ncbi:MAG: hypothetical protein B6242_03845 [Anaerolineaceae bacterium 4572_78]|nr:MAG: hypothetical protein B6242_03845 [Anaerolineaceae bacterium 4572_78]
MTGDFYALTMFMDISGFTPMTEALMLHGKQVAEILSGILNDIFYPVIKTVYDNGGFITGFAGDAFTAVFQTPPHPSPAQERVQESDSPLLERGGVSAGVKNELFRTKSFLGAFVGLRWDDSLYEQLDPKLRYENTLHAIKNIFFAESILQPVIIEIEDLHWIDDDSLKLVETILRGIEGYQIFMVAGQVAILMTGVNHDCLKT